MIMRIVMISILISLLSIQCKSPVIQNQAPDEYSYNENANGPKIKLIFKKGESHNHPLMAFWAEDMDGNFIQTLFVAESIGKGVFQHGDASQGKWMPGEIRRPAALPVWSHSRGVKAEDGLFVPGPKNPVADAFTGPTPPKDFIIKTALNEDPPQKFMLYFEINQTWDWNEYWTNSRYPDNEEYKTSCQPALVYRVEIDQENLKKEYMMEAIGHSHYAGEDGKIYPDLSTITTALEIADEINVIIGD